ncbi:AbrB/MazE/SpoVT family DNA-binding domain-containing protein [Desulfosoma sp.]|uniref:AbrB/MazE/SpoVT family DNA-binding domain-containing protein n=1 Tax=Desulfosoma sp. TaxID=2603217 RepID=UPI00404B56DD
MFIRKERAMDVEYKNIDPKLIVNEIRNGRSLEAVQKLFGLRLKSEVQDLYLKGLMELGEIPQLGFGKNRASEPAPHRNARPVTQPRVREKLQERPEPEIITKPMVRRRPKQPEVQAPSVVIKTTNHRTIGQSGSITLNKALLIDQLGFSVGDTFEIYREDDRVILRKLPEPLL